MDSLTPNLTPADTTAASTAPQSSDRWAMIRPYKKWLILVGGLAIIIILLLIALGVKSLVSPAHQVAVKTNTKTQSAPTPSPTIDAAQDQFFASLPQSVVYYSYAQTSGSRNVYQSDITDTHRRNVNVGFPDSYTFLASPDGKWLIRYNDRQIEQAQSNTPGKFTTIYTYPSNNLELTSAIFSRDSSHLVIVLSRVSQTPAGAQGAYFTNQIITVPVTADKSQRAAAVVLNSDRPYRFKLLGFSDPQLLWYAEDRDDRLSNVNNITIATGQTGNILTSLNGQLDKMQFSPDMHYGYSNNGTYISEYDLTTQQARVVYSLGFTCAYGEQNNTAISGLSVSPNQQLLVTIQFQPCKSARPSPGTVPPPNQRTLLINAHNGQVVQSQDNQPITDLTDSSWSPDGQHVWLTVDPATHYILDIDQLQIHAIPSLDRQTLTKEKLYLLGWLTPFKS